MLQSDLASGAYLVSDGGLSKFWKGMLKLRQDVTLQDVRKKLSEPGQKGFAENIAQ